MQANQPSSPAGIPTNEPPEWSPAIPQRPPASDLEELADILKSSSRENFLHEIDPSEANPTENDLAGCPPDAENPRNDPRQRTLSRREGEPHGNAPEEQQEGMPEEGTDAQEDAQEGKHGVITERTEEKLDGEKHHLSRRKRARQRAYLAALASMPVPLPRFAAAKVGGIQPQTLSEWRKDPEFSAAEAEAAKASTELLVASAADRAVNGYLRPIYQLGVLVGYERIYPERLHIEVLRAFRPEFKKEGPKSVTTNNNLILASPEEVLEAVRRLSPTSQRADALPEPKRIAEGKTPEKDAAPW